MRMSDYLNNIVARSLSVADVVQPRVPHLFEQTVTATPVDAEPVSRGESVAERVIDYSEAQQIPYSASPSAPVNPTVASPVLEQFQPEPAAPVALSPTQVLPEPPMPDTSTKSAATAAANAPATQQRRAVNQNAGRVVDPVVPSRVGPSQTKPSATVRNGEPVTRRTAASISQAALPPVNRGEQQLAPIRINIGRVDVRAIMPAAPPVVPNSSRPKPALSLESYLKQREEGKR